MVCVSEKEPFCVWCDHVKSFIQSEIIGLDSFDSSLCSVHEHGVINSPLNDLSKCPTESPLCRPADCDHSLWMCSHKIMENTVGCHTISERILPFDEK